MGALTILNKTKKISYSFLNETIKMNGDSELSDTNKINSLNGSILIIENGLDINIGNYNLNSINIYNQLYEDSIDIAAIALKALKTEIELRYPIL